MKHLILFMALTGCQQKWVKVVDDLYCSRETKITDFVIQCSNAANPMSDEEPEDLVTECNRVARLNYCKHMPHVKYTARFHFAGSIWTQRIVPCVNAQTDQEISLCTSVGFEKFWEGRKK